MKSRQEAEDDCRQTGAYLMTINDEDEEHFFIDFVLDLAPRRMWSMGVTHSEVEHMYKWNGNDSVRLAILCEWAIRLNTFVSGISLYGI